MVRSGDVPSRGDALLLGAYRFLVAGLSLSVDEDPDRAGLIDAGIVTTALTALAWIFLVEPAIQADDVAVAVRAVAVAFPLAGIVVVVLALRLAFTGRSTPCRSGCSPPA